MARGNVTLFAKFDVDYPSHPLIASLTSGAFRAHVEMILWSHRHRTGGRVDLSTWTPEQIRELRSAGLLDGDVLTDFHDYPRGGHDGRPRIPTSIRRKVYKRDHYRCSFCSSREALSLDHVIRYRDGGPDTEDNLRVLCLPCNQRRG